MGKLAYWERLLAEFIVSCRDKQFELGKWDCIHFARESERVIYGDSTMDNLDETHQYHDAKSMIRLLKEHDCETVWDLVSLHKQEVIVPLMHRGDWVGVEASHGHAIGVWDGRQIWVTSEIGLASMPYESAVMAWKVR